VRNSPLFEGNLVHAKRYVERRMSGEIEGSINGKKPLTHYVDSEDDWADWQGDDAD